MFFCSPYDRIQWYEPACLLVCLHVRTFVRPSVCLFTDKQNLIALIHRKYQLLATKHNAKAFSVFLWVRAKYWPNPRSKTRRSTLVRPGLVYYNYMKRRVMRKTHHSCGPKGYNWFWAESQIALENCCDETERMYSSLVMFYIMYFRLEWIFHLYWNWMCQQGHSRAKDLFLSAVP